MPHHPRTPLPTHPDAGTDTAAAIQDMDKLSLIELSPNQSTHAPVKPCCRSSEATDARMTRMGDPLSHAGDDAPAVLRVSLDEGARLPTRATEGDAGLDLFPLEGTLPRLMPHETRVFDTGVRVEIPPGYVGKVEGRSGLAKRGICPIGSVVDSGYRGPIGIILTNVGQAQWVAEPGKSIAQLVIYPCALMTPMVVECLGNTERGGNGFGSSDRNSGGPAR